MTIERDLIRQLTNALEVLQKESVTTPYNQTIVVGGVAHSIPIGNDVMARDAIYADLLFRARPYLGQPEPKEPTVMEIIALADEIEAEGLGQVDLVRRALARWGRPAIEPVPASERLPGPEDCDTEGRCWWFRGDSPILNAYWDLSKGDSADPVPPTAWLPHHALPVPTTPTEPNGQT